MTLFYFNKSRSLEKEHDNNFAQCCAQKRWNRSCLGAQRAKLARKVHKPPLVINFELNGFNVFLWVPWSLSESKVFKWKETRCIFAPNLAFFTLATSRGQYGGL